MGQTLAEYLEAKGMARGRTAGWQDGIMSFLRARYGAASRDVCKEVIRIDNPSALKALMKTIAKTDALEEIRAQLSSSPVARPKRVRKKPS